MLRQKVSIILVIVGALTLTGCSLFGQSKVNNAPIQPAPTVDVQSTDASDTSTSSGPVASSTITSSTTVVTPTTPPVTKSETKTFEITAKNWEFIPSTITVNQGDKVKMVIKSVDVDHSFAMPAFGINQKLVPGQTETIEFVADKTGSFPFRCSVYCGSGHKEMDGTLIVK